MAELSTFNADTHIKTGAEQVQETSATSVNEEGAMQESSTQEATQETNQQEQQAVAQTEQNEETQTPENETSFTFETGVQTDQQEAATQQTAVKEYNWKEEIGKIDPNELYAHLGINDFALKMNDHLKKGGKASDFISVNGVNYDEVSDEELVRQDIKEKFPNLSSSEVNRMFNRKYGVSDELDETEIEDKQLDLKSAAYQVRVQKKNEQANYKMPEPIAVKDEKYEAWQNEIRQQETLQTQISNYYNEHPTTKNLNETKRVAINLGDGVEPFNIVVDKPEVLTKMMAESALYKTPMLTKTGEPDVHRHQLVTLFEANPQKFITDIFNYGKSVAGRAKVAEGQNAIKPKTPISTTVSQEPSYGTGKYNHSTHGK